MQLTHHATERVINDRSQQQQTLERCIQRNSENIARCRININNICPSKTIFISYIWLLCNRSCNEIYIYIYIYCYLIHLNIEIIKIISPFALFQNFITTVHIKWPYKHSKIEISLFILLL